MLEKALESIAQSIEHHADALNRIAEVLEKRDKAAADATAAVVQMTKQALDGLRQPAASTAPAPAECTEVVQPAKKVRAAKAPKTPETKSEESIAGKIIESAPEAEAEQAAAPKIVEPEPAAPKAEEDVPKVIKVVAPGRVPTEEAAEQTAPAPSYELPEGVGVEEAKRRIYKALAEALKFAAANAPKRSDQLREFCIKHDCRNPLKMPDENVAEVFTLMRTELKLEP